MENNLTFGQTATAKKMNISLLVSFILRMTILASREHTCIDPEVSNMPKKTEECKNKREVSKETIINILINLFKWASLQRLCDRRMDTRFVRFPFIPLSIRQ